MGSMSSSAARSLAPDSIQVPSEIFRKWQETVDLLADIMHVPSASIMRVGLSISRSIIEVHGGRLWASANVPCGAIFQFTLPARPAP